MWEEAEQSMRGSLVGSLPSSADPPNRPVPTRSVCVRAGGMATKPVLSVLMLAASCLCRAQIFFFFSFYFEN
jgi:hypothetical protein